MPHSNDINNKEDKNEFNSLLGAPPVWSTENVEDYYRVLENLMNCLGARDFMEKILIRDVAVTTWEIIRMGRQKGLGVERKFRERLQFQAKRTPGAQAKKGNDRAYTCWKEPEHFEPRSTRRRPR